MSPGKAYPFSDSGSFRVEKRINDKNARGKRNPSRFILEGFAGVCSNYALCLSRSSCSWASASA